MSEENDDQPVALVTGGGTGIGSACCRRLAAEGFRVGIHYRSSEEKAEKLCAELVSSSAGGAFTSISRRKPPASSPGSFWNATCIDVMIFLKFS